MMDVSRHSLKQIKKTDGRQHSHPWFMTVTAGWVDRPGTEKTLTILPIEAQTSGRESDLEPNLKSEIGLEE